MATLRDIRNRIGSVEKIQKIVTAMKMVAAAKLARATAAIHSARPYAEKLREVMVAVSGGVDADAHPLLEVRDPVRRLDLVVCTSDRGLCGAFNQNLIKHAQAIRRKRDDLDEIRIIPVGRQGLDFFNRRRAEIPRSWTGISTVRPPVAREIARWLMERYLTGETDEVGLVYSEFVSALVQRPRDEVLLPVKPEEGEDTESGYEIEPSPEELLARLVPSAVEFAVFRALLETQAGEHGARMTAMDNASSNTEELIRTLSIDYNKARQATITAELVEIVSGADAV